MTSGMMRGAVTRPENSVRPRKARKRTRAIPANVPSMVARVEETRAIFRLNIRAAITCLLWNRASYHLVENPPQTVTRREPLNE